MKTSDHLNFPTSSRGVKAPAPHGTIAGVFRNVTWGSKGAICPMPFFWDAGLESGMCEPLSSLCSVSFFFGKMFFWMVLKKRTVFVQGNPSPNHHLHKPPPFEGLRGWVGKKGTAVFFFCLFKSSQSRSVLMLRISDLQNGKLYQFTALNVLNQNFLQVQFCLNRDFKNTTILNSFDWNSRQLSPSFVAFLSHSFRSALSSHCTWNPEQICTLEGISSVFVPHLFSSESVRSPRLWWMFLEMSSLLQKNTLMSHI